tara:strand:+ start:531 stop:782 length:252 start_codon:yes stop_codon:yes gene_type:complete
LAWFLLRAPAREDIKERVCARSKVYAKNLLKKRKLELTEGARFAMMIADVEREREEGSCDVDLEDFGNYGVCPADPRCRCGAY